MEKASKETERYSLIDIFKRPLMRVVSLVVMFGWFTVNVVFYGLTLNVGTLAGLCQYFHFASLSATDQIKEGGYWQHSFLFTKLVKR